MLVKFRHLWGKKCICQIWADYGHAIQYVLRSFLKNKFLSFEEWVSRSRVPRYPPGDILVWVWNHFYKVGYPSAIKTRAVHNWHKLLITMLSVMAINPLYKTNLLKQISCRNSVKRSATYIFCACFVQWLRGKIVQVSLIIIYYFLNLSWSSI